MNHKLDQWKKSLSKALCQELPGAKAHVKLAPIDRIEGLEKREWPIDAKRSAVSFLLYPKNGKIHTLFMKRPEYPGVHSGQVSLPGGQREASDAHLLATAIREYEEETGILLEESDYLAPLTEFYIPPSNFLVQPYVALVKELGSLHPDPTEVESLHEVALEDLFLKENFKVDEIQVRQRKGAQYTIQAPCYQINDLRIWGATAMMISELQMIFKKNHLSLFV